MLILPLIAATFTVFLLLWTGDLYFTLRSVKEVGRGVELNPILKRIMGFRGRYIGLFKVLEIGIFSYLIWRLAQLDEEKTFSLLMGAIVIYCIVVAAGMKAFIDVTGKSTPVALLLVCIMIVLTLFVYLTHIEYQNKVVVSQALANCSSKYSELYNVCAREQSQENNSELQKFDLNFTIPEWNL